MDRPGHSNQRHLEDAVEGDRIAMVTTEGRLGLRSRPLTVAQVEEDRIMFLVSESTDWVRDLQPGAATECTFVDDRNNHYVAVSGESKVVHDRALIERLWSPAASAFFDGADDPDLRVLEVKVAEGQWWDGPDSRAGTLLALVRSAVTHDPDPVGEQGVVRPG
jgi:general stress protein 26